MFQRYFAARGAGTLFNKSPQMCSLSLSQIAGQVLWLPSLPGVPIIYLFFSNVFWGIFFLFCLI